MVKKSILMALFTFYGIVSVFASGNLSVVSGYCRTKSIMNYYPGVVIAINMPQIGAGYFVDVSGAYWYHDWWGIGGKVSYSSLSAYDSGFEVMTNVDLYKLLIGVPLLLKWEFLHVGLDIYGGYGVVDVLNKYVGTVVMYGPNSYRANGKGLVMDLDVKLQINITNTFSILLSVGNTIADFDRLMCLGELQAGLDVSNMRSGIGLNYRFTSEHWPFYD